MPKNENKNSSEAITIQPKPMPEPKGKSGQLIPFMIPPTTLPPQCPPGLEYLTFLDNVVINQCIQLEWFIEIENAYQVMSNGYMLYWAQEYSEYCNRQCFGENRAFELILTNQFGAQVLRIERPQKCCSLDIVTVMTADRQLLGTVEENLRCCTPDFTLRDKFDQPFLKIIGPACHECYCTVEFQVLTMQNVEVGTVTKQWTSWAQELFTKANLFGVTFPVDLPVEGKAVILGACFLIDFRYFERSG